MTGLKTLVISMGILILLGIGLVGYGLTRTHRPPEPITAAAFASDLPVPHGAKLVSVNATQDRVVLHFSASDGDKILLLDPHNGQVMGSVNLVP
jgi:hypothetical protein